MYFRMRGLTLMFIVSTTWIFAGENPPAPTPSLTLESLDAERDAVLKSLLNSADATREEIQRAENAAYAYLKFMHENGNTTTPALKARVSYHKIRTTLSEHNKTSLEEELRAHFSDFPGLDTAPDNTGFSKVQEIVLNRKPVFVGGSVYDGIRITADVKSDFIWAFTSHPGIAEWYIVAEAGAMNGFKQWYQCAPYDWKGFDDLPFDAPKLMLQRLDRNSIEKDKSYVIWFHIVTDEEVKIRVTGGFKETPDTFRSVSTALMKPMLPELKKAAENGDAEAQCKVGRCYTSNFVVDNDPKEALAWFQKAAAQDNATAMSYLGQMYHNGRGVTKDVSEAIRWYSLATDHGCGDAADFLAKLYYDGVEVPQDLVTSTDWSRKAAALGNTNAQEMLAWAYILGRGVKQDQVEATRLYQMSADLNSRKGQALLGNRYLLGLGIAQSDTEAFKWYQLAAQDQDYVGEYRLAGMYFRGRGVDKDYDIAFDLIRRGADRGFAKAECLLGKMYLESDAAHQNFDEALKWFQKSADHKESEASFMLGSMYEQGKGVVKDVPQAREWYQRASDLGHKGAKARLDNTDPTPSSDF